MNDLTVIVTFHNLERQVRQTLQSVRAAAGERVEVLLVDDASTDRTPERLEQGLGLLPRARLHRCETNLGPSGARNLAMSMVETEYLTFLDGDDFVARGYYPALLDSIVAAGCPMVRTDHIEVVGNRRSVRRVPDRNRGGRVGSPRESILPMDRRTAIDHCNVWAGAYHRSLISNGTLHLREDLRTAEDRLWIWQLFLNVDSFTVPDVLGVFYRRDVPGSATAIADTTRLDFFAAMESIFELIGADPDQERFLPKALRRFCELLLHHYGMLDRLAPELRHTFKVMAAQTLQRCPQDALHEVFAGLTPERRYTLTRLMQN